jgi:hypothetical protein
LGDPDKDVAISYFSRFVAKNPWQFAIRIPLVKAEVVLPDR